MNEKFPYGHSSFQMVSMVTMIVSDSKYCDRFIDPHKLAVIKQLQIGGVLTERKIASLSGLSHVTVSKILEELRVAHVARAKKVGRANLWELNLESYVFKSILPIINDWDAILPPKEALKSILLQELPLYIIEKVVLFGSVRSGAERDSSDIDVGIFLKSKVDPADQELEEKLEKTISSCHVILGKRLSPYFVTAKKKNRKSSLPEKIEKSGEQIYP